jgi:hypothetical protein
MLLGKKIWKLVDTTLAYAYELQLWASDVLQHIFFHKLAIICTIDARSLMLHLNLSLLHSNKVASKEN